MEKYAIVQKQLIFVLLSLLVFRDACCTYICNFESISMVAEIIGVSMSEPHTSELNGRGSLIDLYHGIQ